MAFRRLCIQRRWSDTYSYRFGNHITDTRHYQESLTGIVSGVRDLSLTYPGGRSLTGSFFCSKKGCFIIRQPSHERTKIYLTAAQCCDPDHPGHLLYDPVMGGGCDRTLIVCDHLFGHAVSHLLPAGEMGLS